MATPRSDGARQVDEYLAGVQEPHRSTLAALRTTLLAVLPDAVEGISYGYPVCKVNGKAIAGYAAFTRHCAYLPHSGSVLDRLTDELAGFTATKGSLHFPVDAPLPEPLVRRLVEVRLAEIAAGKPR